MTKRRRPDLAPAEVRPLLAATARGLGPAGPDTTFGAGLLDAGRLLGAGAAGG